MKWFWTFKVRLWKKTFFIALIDSTLVVLVVGK
jgi:hypothetical protein